MNKTWICAFPTNDGIHLVNNHFGEAEYFDLYRIGKEEVTFLKRIENQSPEEKGHGDPNKARNITQILKKENVQVMLSLKFGGNIFRMLSQFSCARVHDHVINSMALKVQQQIDRIESNWEMGEHRRMIQFEED
ncbi:MAG: hypothetical protein JXR71_03520 [Bacteroidales bacterium]|nr:hypothetical protein [Bacteroidales bacterium]